MSSTFVNTQAFPDDLEWILQLQPGDEIEYFHRTIVIVWQIYRYCFILRVKLLWNICTRSSFEYWFDYYSYRPTFIFIDPSFDRFNDSYDVTINVFNSITHKELCTIYDFPYDVVNSISWVYQNAYLLCIIQMNNMYKLNSAWFKRDHYHNQYN